MNKNSGKVVHKETGRRSIYERERQRRGTPGCATPQATPPAAKVDLLKRAYSAQRDAVKTPRDLARRATIVLIVGPVLCGALLLIRALGGRIEESMGGFGWIGLAGLLLFVIILGSPLLALYQFGLVLFRRRRRVACPFCGVTHSIFQGVESYICTDCGHILRFSRAQGGTSLLEAATVGPFVAVQCPRCGTEWGSDAEQIRCFACGLPLIVRDGAAVPAPPDARCPHCDAEAHAGSFLCGACGELISEPEALDRPAARDLYSTALPPVRGDGMDAISLMAMPASGHIIAAYWAARKGCAVIDALGDKQPDWGALWQAVVVFTNRMILLNTMLYEMPETAAAILGLRSAIQARYARLLGGAVEPQVRNAGDFAALHEYQALLKRLADAEAKQRTLLSDRMEAWAVQSVAAAQGRVVAENAAAVCQWDEAAAGAPDSSPEPIRMPLHFLKRPSRASP